MNKLVASGLLAATLVSSACGKVKGTEAMPDARNVEHDIDASAPDAAAALGSKDHPAKSCVELQVAGAKSGPYWLQPTGLDAVETYCDQDTNGGGWALVVNSVKTDGKTLIFWQFPYADRFKTAGTPAPDQNFYAGSLYKAGTTYMDVIADLNGKSTVAMIASTTGIDPDTMRFAKPELISGNKSLFDFHFAAGWSSADHDGDDHAASNCAATYNNVAQHYHDCWYYNLGADVESGIDGGVGPHVDDGIMGALGLGLQPSSGGHSQVSRIARLAKW